MKTLPSFVLVVPDVRSHCRPVPRLCTRYSNRPDSGIPLLVRESLLLLRGVHGVCTNGSMRIL